MYTQHFIIEGRPFGTGDRGFVYTKEVKHIPWSVLYVCRYCGNEYARAPVLVAGVEREYTVHTGVCRRCAQRTRSVHFDIPGSIWRSWDAEFVNAFPPEVLRWELERHIEHTERWNEHSNRQA